MGPEREREKILLWWDRLTIVERVRTSALFTAWKGAMRETAIITTIDLLADLAADVQAVRGWMARVQIGHQHQVGQPDDVGNEGMGGRRGVDHDQLDPGIAQRVERLGQAAVDADQRRGVGLPPVPPAC